SAAPQSYGRGVRSADSRSSEVSSSGLVQPAGAWDERRERTSVSIQRYAITRIADWRRPELTERPIFATKARRSRRSFRKNPFVFFVSSWRGCWLRTGCNRYSIDPILDFRNQFQFPVAIAELFDGDAHFFENRYMQVRQRRLMIAWLL